MTAELSKFAARLRGLIERGEFSQANFESMALELFALQFRHNAPYRKFCEARRVTPLTATRWTEIPAVPTAAFKELELTCLSPAERARVFHSSGTTEQRPSRHFHGAESLAVYEASLWTWFKEIFRTAISGFQLVVLTPPPAQAPNSSLVHMFDVLRQKAGAADGVFVGRRDAGGAWTLDLDAARQALGAAEGAGQATLLLGTAFAFVHLGDALAEARARCGLPPGSGVLETGGYKGRSRSLPKSELHSLITERLGVPASHIVCEYGMSELSSQAYDRAAGEEWCVTGDAENSRHTSPVTRHFHFPPWARGQIISPETGREVAECETGLLRVFDLANVFSVLALQTEDLAIRRGEGFELIGRAQAAEPRGCSLMAV